MIEFVDLQGYLERHCPWLFHGTAVANLASIAERGIQPGSRLGRSNAKQAFHRTRRGHVYLSQLEHCRRLQAAGDIDPGTVRVDLRLLDPQLIDPDEDMVQHARWFDNERWVSIDPPLFGPNWSAGPNGEGTLDHWAETTPGFDAPEVTTRSLQRGRISYCGVVPASAVELFEPFTSPSV